MRAGSLFSGAGLLDLAVADAFGARTVWVAENDAAASRVLAARFPGVPNHRDVRTAAWHSAEPVDLTAAGYPCQGESNAGKRLGDADPRWMWPAYRRIIAMFRPRLAVGENVRSHLGRSFRHVVADLLGLRYAVVWGVVAASDVGACHERKRLWWIAWPQEYGPPAGLGTHPFAHLDDGVMVTDDLFGGAPTTEWPYAGAAYAGAAYAGAAYAAAAPGPSLLPTVRTSDTNGAGAHGDGGLDLRTAVSLLPTPAANDSGNTPEDHLRKKPGRTVVTSPQVLVEGGLLATGGQLLPTPDAGHYRKETRSGPLLAGAVELLPTPDASMGNGGRQRSEEALRSGRHQVNLNDLPRLLPTTRATDGAKGGPNQRGSAGDLTLPSAVQPERFGPYAPAVARWEALTRPAPDPTVPGRGGKRRLSPAFAEWMMGAPNGWITGVPGVTRTDALRIAGNGVVRQQAAAALSWLASRAPVEIVTSREASA